MFSLPLLAGLLFILQGQHNCILEARKVQLDPFLYRRFVKELYEQERRKALEQLEKRQNEHVPVYNNIADNNWLLEEDDVDDVVDKALDSQIKYAEKQPEERKTDDLEDTGQDEQEKPAPSTDLSVSTEINAAGAPLPPQKQKQAGDVVGLKKTDITFAAIVGACSIAGLVGLIMAGVCWYKLHTRVKAASDVDYPAYGVTGPTKERLPSPGDRKLAQSAQMYHYQHQKQQMIAMEKANCEMKHDASDDESEEENEEGDYTVYECPGLAPTGEMEIRNPLFTEEVQTPVNDSDKSATKDLTDDTHE